MAAGKITKIPDYINMDLNPAPQVDDPDTFINIPAVQKRPVVQIIFAVLAALSCMIALAVNEMSRGEVNFEIDQNFDTTGLTILDEVKYGCGWQAIALKYVFFQFSDDNEPQVQYDEYRRLYTGHFCKKHDEFVDPDFCEESELNGKVWLSCGIIGLLLVVATIPIVWFRGKQSFLYAAGLGLSMIFLIAATMNWLFNDTCEDVEDWGKEAFSKNNIEHLTAAYTTGLGISMILMFLAIFFEIIGILVSSIHLFNPEIKPYPPHPPPPLDQQ